ncbi:MAG: hypothetical protein WCJ35_15325 [Planctomycetota bacterium]
MRFNLSWLAVVAVVALLYVLVKGLANPRTRPFVIVLGVLGAGFLVLCFVWKGTRIPPIHESASRSVATNQVIKMPPAPLPLKSSATETKQPKVTVITALRQAIVQAWTARDSASIAEAPEKPANTSHPDVPAKPQPPAWVNAAPIMQDNWYRTSVRVGPFTTPLECERELVKSLQGAVSEYAELSLSREAAAVRLPDDALQQLVQERWTEVWPVEIGGGHQDMVSLHALVVFDLPMQQRIKSEAQRLVIGQRVQGAAVVFGGVLGFLALAWGSLKLATRRQAES